MWEVGDSHPQGHLWVGGAAREGVLLGAAEGRGPRTGTPAVACPRCHPTEGPQLEGGHLKA